MDLPTEISESFQDPSFQSEYCSQVHNIPIELWQEILERSDLLSQIRLRQVCKYFYGKLHITDLCDIPNKYRKKITDEVSNFNEY